MSARFQQALLVFFIIGIAALLYGIWATTPRQPQPGSCLILEQKYCDKGEEIVLDINGSKSRYVAFSISPGDPIFSPHIGLLVKGQESGNLSGYVAQVRKIEGGAAIFRGDIEFEDMLQKNVSKGDIVARVGNTETRINSKFNLVFTLTKRANDGAVVDEEMLNDLFN